MQLSRPRRFGWTSRRRRVVGLVATLLLTAAGLWFAARGVDPDKLAATFRGVQWGWIVAGASATVIQILMFGIAWRTGLRAAGVGDVALRHVISATWIGRAGNAVLPAKMGEVARVVVIRRHLSAEDGSVPRLAGTLIAQRILGAIATVIIVALVALTMPLPVPVADMAAVGAALGAAVVLAITLRGRIRLGSRIETVLPRRMRGWIGSMIDGTGILRLRGPAVASVGMHLVACIAQLTTVACLLRAFDVAAPASAPLVVVAMVALAGLLPTSPGGIGVAQAAIVAPLGATYGVTADRALGFALGLQATVLLVAVAGGLLGLTHQRLSRMAAAVA
jgi:uncharacterized membrane protein YbhN (UPF0104 family)